jgi:single-strand DNA-binding protein
VAGFTINTVVISGNLTREPELRSLPTGTSVCELGVAVNERIKDSAGNWTDRANFFDVTVWGGMGEWVARNVGKGAAVVVEGRLRYEAWETEGQKRSKVKIVANSIIPRDGGGGGGNSNGYSAPQSDVPANTDDFAAAPAPVAAPVGGGPADDDIPF